MLLIHSIYSYPWASRLGNFDGVETLEMNVSLEDLGLYEAKELQDH
jgi:hypothetical protein